MKIICTDLHTERWHAARKGVITASHMTDVLSAPESKRYRAYLHKVALDLAGIPDHKDEHPDPWIETARSRHAWAVRAYKLKSWGPSMVITPCGFCIHDEHYWLGCATYGLCGEAGPVLSVHYRKALSTWRAHRVKISKPEMDRAQAIMLVTGRDSCVVINYWYGDDEHEEVSWLIAERDEARIGFMLEQSIRFRAAALFKAREYRR